MGGGAARPSIHCRDSAPARRELGNVLMREQLSTDVLSCHPLDLNFNVSRETHTGRSNSKPESRDVSRGTQERHRISAPAAHLSLPHQALCKRTPAQGLQRGTDHATVRPCAPCHAGRSLCSGRAERFRWSQPSSPRHSETRCTSLAQAHTPVREPSNTGLAAHAQTPRAPPTTTASS